MSIRYGVTRVTCHASVAAMMRRVFKGPLPYVRIFGTELFSSSLMRESVETRFLFLWFISMADEDGYVPFHDAWNLSRLTNIAEALIPAALAALEAPDPSSRSKVADGRRLLSVEGGGWHVVNVKAYREVQTRKQVVDAQRKARQRAREYGFHDPGEGVHRSPRRGDPD